MTRFFDQDAVAALFRAHGDKVFRRALRLLGNAADAEEATQEVFVRVLRSEDGDRGRGTTAAWLVRVTTNLCLNQLRDRHRRRELLALHGDEAPVEQADQADLATLRVLLGRADEREARAAIHVFLDGMSYSEAAELLGVSKRTVGNLVERFQAFAANEVGRSGRSR